MKDPKQREKKRMIQQLLDEATRIQKSIYPGTLRTWKVVGAGSHPFGQKLGSTVQCSKCKPRMNKLVFDTELYHKMLEHVLRDHAEEYAGTYKIILVCERCAEPQKNIEDKMAHELKCEAHF